MSRLMRKDTVESGLGARRARNGVYRPARRTGDRGGKRCVDRVSDGLICRSLIFRRSTGDNCTRVVAPIPVDTGAEFHHHKVILLNDSLPRMEPRSSRISEDRRPSTQWRMRARLSLPVAVPPDTQIPPHNAVNLASMKLEADVAGAPGCPGCPSSLLRAEAAQAGACPASCAAPATTGTCAFTVW
jgi:hypothetical protein